MKSLINISGYFFVFLLLLIVLNYIFLSGQSVAIESQKYESNDRQISDMIDFGNSESEIKSNLQETNSETGSDDLQETYRRLSNKGKLVFELSVNPDVVNYFTVKLRGDDVGGSRKRLNVNFEKSGTRMASLVNGPYHPPFSGRYYYATYKIPEQRVTSDSISLELEYEGEVSPVILRAYTHSNSFFKPLEEVKQGEKPVKTEKIPEAPDKVSEYEYLKDKINHEVDNYIKNYQYYGEKWEEKMKNGKIPEFILGALHGYGTRDIPDKSDTAWGTELIKSLGGNATYLNLVALFARTYNAEWSNYYQDDEIIDRVVKALDFYTRAQGNNGGFLNDRWVGGPERRESTHVLEAVGHVYLIDAFLMLHEEIEDKGYFEENIDNDNNAETLEVPRRLAYAQLFEGIRHNGIKHISPGNQRGVPNQILYHIRPAYSANEALKILLPDQTWRVMEDEDFHEHLDVAVGLALNQWGSYWFSPKTGLSNEAGYSEGYGGDCVHLLLDLWQRTEYKPIKEVANKAVKAFSYFQFPSVSSSNYKVLMKEGYISRRGFDEHPYPGRIGYEVNPYAALELNNETAIRQAQLYLKHNRAYVEDYDWEGAHKLSRIWKAIDILENINKLKELPKTDYRLPMERDEDVIFTDEYLGGAGVAAFKHRDKRMYIYLNWDGNWQEGPEELAWAPPGFVSNLARIHFTTETVDRIATVNMSTPEGYGKIYELDYGDYMIRMNLSGDESFTTEFTEEKGEGVDLVTGKKYDLSEKVEVSPKTTLIIYNE